MALPFFGKSEEQKELASEKRQMNFAEKQLREKVAAESAMSAAEDQTHMYEQERKAELLRWQQDSTGQINQLSAKLLGLVQVGEDEWEKNPGQKALCNELFINDWVNPLCSAFLSKDYVNSNLEESRILNQLHNTFDDLVIVLTAKHEFYGIDVLDLTTIVRLLKEFVIGPAYRPYKGFTKIKDSGIHKAIETTYTHPLKEGESKKKVLGLI